MPRICETITQLVTAAPTATLEDDEVRSSESHKVPPDEVVTAVRSTRTDAEPAVVERLIGKTMLFRAVCTAATCWARTTPVSFVK